jgi:hypothetical protein
MQHVPRRLAATVATLAILCLPMMVPAAEPCATVSFTFSSPVVERGDFIRINASIGNCSESVERLTIRYEIATPCTRTVAFSVKANVPPGEFSATFPFYVFRFACPGDYTVTVKVSSGTTLLASSTATVTVV